MEGEGWEAGTSLRDRESSRSWALTSILLKRRKTRAPGLCSDGSLQGLCSDGSLQGSWDWGEPASSLLSLPLLPLLSYGTVPLGTVPYSLIHK